MITCTHCGAANSPDSAFCTECGRPLAVKDALGGLETPMPDAMRRPAGGGCSLDLAPGSVFADRYTIVDVIGQGGMGVVYRARETLGSRERDIALKLIRADRLADAAAIDRLVNEGVLTQDIRHPNVVGVYNVGVAGSQPFVAMELVEGISLREWLRRQMNAGREVSLNATAGIIRAILDGLAEAHRLGVIHRDLKPENVILTGEPEAIGSAASAPLKLLDFGIARAPGSRDGHTGSGSGTGLGTPNYMAPEQITNPAAAGPPADLYSLSVIFYELLMGVLPAGHWQPPSGGRADVPEAVDKLIQDGLANRLLSRPQNVAEYRARLDAALPLAAPAPAPRPTPTPRPVPLVSDGVLGSGSGKARKWMIGIGGAAAAIIGLAAIAEEEGGTGGTGGGSSGGAVSGYEMLSGSWNYANGASVQVRVAPDGSFEGQGSSADGTPIAIAGSLPSGQFVAGNQMLQLQGRLSPGSSDCHLDFETYNPDGSLNWRDTFHIDHAPGQPCPARFGG